MQKPKVVTKFAKKPMAQRPKVAKVAKTEAELRIVEKLKEADSSLKVWVGGLTPGFDWKKLQQHFQKVGRPRLVHVNDRGTAVAVFDSAFKVRRAVTTLNGSKLDGHKIQVDVWTGGDKADRANKPKTLKPTLKPQAKMAPFNQKQTLKQKPKMALSSLANQRLSKQQSLKPKLKMARSNMVKQQNLKATAQALAKPKVDAGIREKLREIDSSLKVWVGGLAKSTTWQALRAHFAKAGARPNLVHINEKSHAGVVTFAGKHEVQQAIRKISGSKLDGKLIKLDVWGRS